MQILPNAKSQFIDSAGQPLASGTVGFYFPGTLNPKPTFQDSLGTIANTNPVQLDSRGQALIWGTGVYRQIVQDASGVTIWDQITEDPNGGLTGNLTDDLFVAGTDFTPGTTTQLTLTAGPGALQNMWVYFDGTYQADNQMSLAGTTLTFNSPIPVGVSLVTVKIGTTIAIGTPSIGSVVDASVAANANIDSSKLSFLQAGSPAVRRTVQSRLRDTLSVKDFGVVGDGTTDDTAKINAALAYVATAGGTLFFPQGNYLVTGTGLLLDQSALVDSDLKHVCISGAGEGATQITYTGTGTAFSYLGAQPNGMNSYLTLENMRFLGTSQTNLSIGISMNLVSTMVMRNVATRVFGTGFVGTDILQSGFYDCAFAVCGGGINMNFGVFSPPNAVLFCNCEIIGNLNFGALIGCCTTVKFLGGAVQNNGKTGTATFRYGVAIITDNGAVGLNGALAASFDSVYFEDNAFEADVWFQAGGSTDGSTALTVTNCTFNRLTNVANQFVNSNIRVDVSTPFKTKLVVIGNGFMGFGTYVPNALTPYIFVSDPFGAAMDTVDYGNLYGSNIEKPTFLGPVKADKFTISAATTFAGSTAATTYVYNTASVVRNSIGNYTVNFQKNSPIANYPVSIAHNGGGVYQVASVNTGSFSFITKDVSGALTDPSYVSAMAFGGGDVV
jgi:hypothetical protein